MHTIHRTVLAGLLLTVVGCSSAPTQQSSTPQVQANEAVSKAANPIQVAEPVRAPEPIPDAPPPVNPVVDAAVDVAKPVVRPVVKAASVAKALLVETIPEPQTAAGDSISGSLKLVAGKGQSVAAGEVSEGLVYFLPKAGSPKPKPGRFVINTRAKGFIPQTLVVPQGSTVRFPNVDTIIHNVFSRSPGNSFDLGYYGPGQSPEYTFNTAGLAIVNCTVHHSMRANVVVLATPYYTRPGKDGSYQIKGVPAGPGTLVFWHPRAAAKSLATSSPLTSAAAQTLVASKSPQVH